MRFSSNPKSTHCLELKVVKCEEGGGARPALPKVRIWFICRASANSANQTEADGVLSVHTPTALPERGWSNGSSHRHKSSPSPQAGQLASPYCPSPVTGVGREH